MWCGADTATVYHNEAMLAEGLSLVLPAHDLSPQDIFITSKLGVYAYVYACVCTCVCMHVCVHVSCMHVCVHVCVCMCMHVCVYMCV